MNEEQQMTDQLTYRGYHIRQVASESPLYPDAWVFEHEDYDGAPDAGDHRCATAPTLGAARQEIDRLYDEYPEQHDA